MKIEDLKEMKAGAPKCGYMLAYLRTKVLFEAYPDLEHVNARLKGNEILELHLFHKEKEYRAIASESLRFPGGVIEHTAEWGEDLNVYTEDILLEDSKKKIRVLNHLIYDENGMITIDDYRLYVEGE